MIWIDKGGEYHLHGSWDHDVNLFIICFCEIDVNLWQRQIPGSDAFSILGRKLENKK